MPDRSSKPLSFFKTLLRWLRSSNYVGKAPIDRLTRDMRLSAAELHKLTRFGPDQTDLLLLRMTAVNLDLEEVRQTVPETCESEWKEYCPNTGALMVLDALTWAPRAE
jgi:hypothetical protein